LAIVTFYLLNPPDRGGSFPKKSGICSAQAKEFCAET